MPEVRFRYEKTGKASYLSHLDMLRTVQRAFLRAGILLKHSEGFNPHPKISIAMPLQLGCESCCEALDASVLTAPDNMTEALNRALPEGIRILSAAAPQMPVGKIAWADWELRFETSDEADRAEALLQNAALPVEKKTKRGISVLDIAPHRTLLGREGAVLMLRLRAGSPNVNTGDVAKALASFEAAPVVRKARRTQFYNEDLEIFR